MLLALARHRLRPFRAIEDLEAALGAGRARIYEKAGDAVLDLEGDPPHRPADHRPRLPESLAHGQPEALAGRLLQHDGGVRLKGVDLDAADVVEVGEHVDVGVAGDVGVELLEVVPAFGVV